MLWGGQSVSRLGSQVSLLALPLLAIATLHATTLQIGLLSASETVPFLLVGLPAGVVVDHLAKRRVMIAGDAGRALVLASIPVAWAAGALTMAQLFVVALMSGVLTVFFDVAYQSYLPDLITAPQLVDGNGKLATTESLAQVAGPAAAGALVQVVGAALAVLVDAVSFAASAFALLGIRVEDRRPPAPEVGGASRPRLLLSEIGEGLRFVFRERHLRSITACTATANLFGGMTAAIIVLYLYRSLHLGPAVIGTAFAIGSVGAVAASLVAGRLGVLIGIGPAILWSAAIGNCGDLLLPLAPQVHPLPFIVAGLFVAGAGAVAYNVSQVSLRQTLCPLQLLGRMNASIRFLVWGTLPVGGVLGGILGTALGLHAALWVGCAGGATAFLWIACSPVPGLRTTAETGARLQLGEVGGPVEVEGPEPMA